MKPFFDLISEQGGNMKRAFGCDAVATDAAIRIEWQLPDDRSRRLMDYFSVKHLHMTCVALSGTFFLLRGIWMLRDSPLLQQRWVRIVPHVVDTLLLASALVLVWMSKMYPFVQSWLTAKVAGLVLYIVLGTIAIKRGKTKQARAAAFFAALLVFAYIVGVALTKNALIFY